MHHSLLRLLGSLALVSMLGACEGEGSIGNARCIGARTRCQLPGAMGGSTATSLVKVSSSPTREATLVWSMSVPCQLCARGSGLLLSDGQLGVWFVTATDSDNLHYERISEQGERTDEGTVVVAQSGASYLQWSRVVRIDGGFTFGASWVKSGTEPGRGLSPMSSVCHHEIVRADSAGTHHIPVGQSPVTYTPGLLDPGLTFSSIPFEDGFVTVLLSKERKIVRKVDALGKLSWQQVALPDWAEIDCGAVVLDHGFALAVSGALPSASSGVLWFDADGNISLQTSLPFGWNPQTRISFVTHRRERVALAGLLATADNPEMPEASTTDLYVIVLGEDTAWSGMRVLAEGPIALSANSLAADPSGNLYVSTFAGTKDAPRGLICVLSPRGDATCHAMPSGVFPQSITSPAPGVVYAVSKGNVVRLQLGE